MQFLERRVADKVGVAADHFAAHRRLRHQRGALRDLLHAGDQCMQFRQGAGADEVAYGGARLHDVRREPPASVMA